jgi:hypothetical protein
VGRSANFIAKQDVLKGVSLLAWLRPDGILTGKFRDVDEDWYVKVGASIVSQSVSASIVPNLLVLATWPINLATQWLLKNRKLTQRKLNQLFEGAEMLLSNRYGALLNILFVIMTYSSARPLLYFFGVVFFASAYWCDKIALLRSMKRPAQYDEKLAVYCTLMMSVSMVVHLALGTWFFGYIEGDVLDIPFITYLPINRLITKRITRKPATVLFFLFFAFVIFEFVARTFGPALVRQIMHQLKGTVEEVKESNPSFFEALENQEISGLDTYNIKKNPLYKDAFSSDIAVDGGESDSDSDLSDDFGDDD